MSEPAYKCDKCGFERNLLIHKECPQCKSELAPASGSVSPLDWQKAKRHFDRVRQQYQELEGTPGVNTTLALRLVFDPLAVRYNKGERTPELHAEMLAVS